MRNRVISIILGLAMLVAATGCTGGDGTSNSSASSDAEGSNTSSAVTSEEESAPVEMQTVVMWSNDQHDQSVFEERIQEFNETIGKEKGIDVEYTVYGSDYYNTLDVAVSAGEGPDIFKCNKIGNYAEAGYILPWEDIPSLQPLIDRFSEYNATGYGEFSGRT